MAPRTIDADAAVADAIATMQRYGYRTLPVVRGDSLLGVVRLADMLKHLAEAYPEEILNLPPRPHQVAETREGG
jgi:CBS domain-containing protein